MAKRNRGIIFLSIGFILFLVVVIWTFYNINEDIRAGQQATDIINKFNESTDVKEVNNMPVITIDGENFCGKIIIDKLDIQLPVYNEWNYDNLKKAPCRYIGNVEMQDIIIAAHNYKSHFGALNKLEIGDIIKFIDPNNKTYLFEVCELSTLDGTAVSDMQAGDWDFSIFTCTISGAQRVTVRCKQINE